jgi:hypothetical protein
MSDYRIEVTGREEFEPREWLRREVLWGYFMTPYSKLFGTWSGGLALDHYNGNVGRRELYATYPDDDEMMSKSFINHGKVIAGLLHADNMFRSMRGGRTTGFVDILELQASTLDRMLANGDSVEPTKETVDSIYGQCYSLVRDIPLGGGDTFRNSRRLLMASRLVGRLAAGELKTWLETATQDDEQPKPTLVIPDGGKARSAGPRVDLLTPVFQQVVDSVRFQELEIIETTLL